MLHTPYRTALITGASSGIGAAFAQALAARGTDLILVARSQARLDQLAADLSTRHRIRVHVLASDLSRPLAAAALFDDVRTQNLDVDLLVNSAGFASYGAFDTAPRDTQLDQILLNVSGLVAMTHAFLPAMVGRGRGAIINVASTAAFQPVPYMAVYGASKAFVLSFSEALWAENRRRGVRVLALCPGATDTPFFDVVQSPEASVGRREKPERVVARALRALERGRSYVISGTGNYLLAHAGRLVPRAMLASTTARVMRPRTSMQAPALPPSRRDARDAQDGR